MIDTIKLVYPANDFLINLFEKYSQKLVKISPDGVILWEKASCQDYLPSSFGSLRINVFDPSDFNHDLPSQRFLAFEWSLQKWHSETGYNQDNTSLPYDLNQLENWVALLSIETNFNFRISDFIVYRVDLSENLELINGAVPDYLRSLELKLCRGVDKIHRYPGGIAQGSRWIGKKIYWKWGEFEAIEKKKHKNSYSISGSAVSDVLSNGKRPLTEIEQGRLVRAMRFELEFRRQYLAKHKCDKIVDISKLKLRFDEEKAKFLTIKKLKEGVSLTVIEYLAVDLTKRIGIDNAKIEFCTKRSERSWYRVKKSLRAKDIRLESILNEDFRGEVEKTDNLKDFELVPFEYVA